MNVLTDVICLVFLKDTRCDFFFLLLSLSCIQRGREIWLSRLLSDIRKGRRI